MSKSLEHAAAEPPQGLTIFGIPFHRPIVTGQKQVAWSSVFLLTLIWFTWGFNIFAGGQALTFTIQKYNKDPRIIAIVMSMAMILMFSPIISYMSDQIWTRFGRRKPFLIVAWIGGFLAMTCFAFLPQVSSAMNHALGLVGIPPASEIVLLAIIIGCYKKMFDGCAPMEPLFLECVPPHQRGRFWAIRGMVFTLAVALFYQILWPRYDRFIDLFNWLGMPGVVVRGEQCIYLLAAMLFLVTGGFIVFCIKETQMPTAANRPIRDLFLSPKKIVADVRPLPVQSNAGVLGYSPDDHRPFLMRIPIVVFLANFARDVFLKVENYPFYIVLVIPAIETHVWGNFNALMQNDQFGYSKQAQADWAFPIQILSFFVITPFAGWYSDVRVKIRWWMRIAMLCMSVASFVTMLWVLRTYSPADIRQVPGFLTLSVVTVLTAMSMIGLYVPLVETMLDYVGREHARAWVSLLTVFKSMIVVGCLYFCIQRSENQVLPIMVWMAFSVATGTLASLMDTFIGPMIYDYMPRSKMGTINAGKGIYDQFLSVGALNLGAWWIVFFSNNLHRPAHVEYDYTSMYILQFVLFIPALAAKVYFVNLIRKGKMQKLGAMEVEGVKPAEKPSEQSALVAADQDRRGRV